MTEMLKMPRMAVAGLMPMSKNNLLTDRVSVAHPVSDPMSAI